MDATQRASELEPLRLLPVLRILTLASQVHHVHARLVCARTRRVRAVEARHLAMYLARELTGWSWPQLGRLFDRNHATVIYGHRVIARRCAASPEFARLIQSFKAQLTA